MKAAAYPHCADRLFGRAHAIEPTALRLLVEGPAARRILSGERPLDEKTKRNVDARKKRAPLALGEAYPVSVGDGAGEYLLTTNGIAVLSVAGILSQRFDWMAALCGWTTYEGLAATFEEMLADDRVQAILMDVESPGGEVAGMLDAGDMIIEANQKKRVWAVANPYAASAAYALAGGAERLYVPRLAQVGSIGIVKLHVDQSEADAAAGEKYTAIYSGARKIDGWGHAPLSEAARIASQKDVDNCRDQFAQLIARQSRISAAAAIATEAAVYRDKDAVEAGLADKVGSFEQALKALTETLASNAPRSATRAILNPQQGEAVMNDKTSATNPTEKPAVDAGTTETVAEAISAPASAEAVTDQARADMSDDEKKPGPGEVCATCGQTMPGEKAQVEATAVHTEVSAILDLCTTQGVSLASAGEFIKAKTPLASVREKIAADKAKAADELQTTATQKDPIVNAGWDDVAAKVNKEFGLKPK